MTQWRILIVEDSPEDRVMYRRLIAQWSDHDCTIVESESGQEGLELLCAEKPDCVLLDYNLPDVNGLEFLSRLAGADGKPSVPTVILTGAGSEAIAVEAMRRGAADYLVKGAITGESLLLAVTNAIEKSALQQELVDKQEELRRSAEQLSRANEALRRQVAERKEAERGLALLVDKLTSVKSRIEQEHKQKEQLLAAITSILIGISEDDRVTHWNSAAEKAFGLAASDVIGKPLGKVSIRWDSAAILRAVGECRANGKALRVDDLHCARPDGSNGFLALSFNPFSSADAVPSGVLILGADITEQRALESQLRQAQKLESIGQLAAGIAHEINTPTQYVGDNTRFLQDAFSDLMTPLKKVGELAEAARSGSVFPELLDELKAAMEQTDADFLAEEIPRAIEQSLEGIDRVTKIVQAMKEFSHPAQEKTAIDINQAIETTITVARNEWKYVAEMVTHLDPDLPAVPCLPGDFNQVILNLIVNAAHAIADATDDGSRGKGFITISTRQVDEWAEIRITDTGTGIPEDIKSKVFDPFFTTKEVGKGTGQGLSIAHAVVVKKHGGTISVDSEVAKGTSFLIRLPMVAPATAAEKVTA